MNNIIKSVALAAVVLVAGIVAMQAIYNNVTGTRSADIQPAAGEYDSGMGATDQTIQHAQEGIHDAMEEAAAPIEEIKEDIQHALEEPAGEDALEETLEDTLEDSTENMEDFPEQH